MEEVNVRKKEYEVGDAMVMLHLWGVGSSARYGDLEGGQAGGSFSYNLLATEKGNVSDAAFWGGGRVLLVIRFRGALPLKCHNREGPSLTGHV